MKRVLLLDQSVYKEVRDDEEMLKYAILIVLLSGFLPALGNIYVASVFQKYTLFKNLSGPLFGWIDIIFMPTFMLVSWLVFTIIAHIPAKFVGGRASLIGFLRVAGFTYAPLMLGVIPLFGTVIGDLWSILCFIFAIRFAHELSWSKSILVIILFFAFFVLLGILLAYFVPSDIFM
jgi:hypothetical protein